MYRYLLSQKWDLESHLYTSWWDKNLKEDVNQDSHIASSPIAQSCFYEEERCSILASSQRKLRGYIEVFKLDVTMKKKIQIRLKFKGPDWFSLNWVPNITQY